MATSAVEVVLDSSALNGNQAFPTAPFDPPADHGYSIPPIPHDGLSVPPQSSAASIRSVRRRYLLFGRSRKEGIIPELIPEPSESVPTIRPKTAGPLSSSVSVKSRRSKTDSLEAIRSSIFGPRKSKASVNSLPPPVSGDGKSSPPTDEASPGRFTSADEYYRHLRLRSISRPLDFQPIVEVDSKIIPLQPSGEIDPSQAPGKPNDAEKLSNNALSKQDDTEHGEANAATAPLSLPRRFTPLFMSFNDATVAFADEGNDTAPGSSGDAGPIEPRSHAIDGNSELVTATEEQPLLTGHLDVTEEEAHANSDAVRTESTFDLPDRVEGSQTRASSADNFVSNHIPLPSDEQTNSRVAASGNSNDVAGTALQIGGNQLLAKTHMQMSDQQTVVDGTFASLANESSGPRSGPSTSNMLRATSIHASRSLPMIGRGSTISSLSPALSGNAFGSAFASKHSSRSSAYTQMSTIPSTTFSDSRQISVLSDTSWEDDVDFCYEQEAEATCDFDWESVVHPSMHISSPGLDLGSSDHSNQEVLSTMNSERAFGQLEPGDDQFQAHGKVAHSRESSVGHRGFRAARQQAAQTQARSSVVPTPLNVSKGLDHRGSVGVTGVGTANEGLEMVESPLLPNELRLSHFSGLVDEKSWQRQSSGSSESGQYRSSLGQYSPNLRTEKRASSHRSQASTSSVAEQWSGRHRHRTRSSVSKLSISLPLQSLPSSSEANIRAPYNHADSSIIPREMQTEPMRNTFTIRRPETPEDRVLLQSAGRASQRGRPAAMQNNGTGPRSPVRVPYQSTPGDGSIWI